MRFRTLVATLLPLAVAGAMFWVALAPGSQAHEPEGSKPPFLGVMLEEETEQAEGGARISRVIDGTAADEAGLEDGDVIVSFDGRAVRGPGGVTKMIREREAGDRVEVIVIRDGVEQSFDVELGSRKHRIAIAIPDLEGLEHLGELKHLEGLEHLGELEDFDFDFDFSDCDGEDCKHGVFSWSNRPRLGVQLTGTTPELRQHLGGGEDAGMLVTRVLPDTPAEEAGISVGDLIVAVDGEAVEGLSDIRRAIRGKDGGIVEVEVIRDGRSQRIDVALPEAEEYEHERSGPHSLRYVPRSEVRDAVREAMAGAREALREAQRVRREAASEARRAVATYRQGSVL